MKVVDYEKQQVAVKDHIVALTKQSGKVGMARLVVALAIAVSFLAGYMEKQSGYYVLAVVFLGGFLYLLRKHQHIEKQISYAKSKHDVLTRYIQRFDQQWHDFEDNGGQYLSDQFPQANDLDLFGKASLYQYICVAHTTFGKHKLAQLLTNQRQTIAEITKRQEAVAELGEQQQWAIDFEAMSGNHSHKNHYQNDPLIQRFLDYAEQKQGNSDVMKLKLWAWGLPVATFAAMILAGLDLISPIFFGLGIAVQLGFGMLGYGKTMAQLEPLYGLHKHIGAYSQLFLIIEQAQFSSPYLKQLQQQLTKQGGAMKAMKDLQMIGDAANIRYNVILYFLFSGLFMWNYQCLIGLQRWREHYGDGLRQWLEILGEIEALLSLAVISQVKEQHCYPQLTNDEQPSFNIEGIIHPLLVENSAVANTITLNHQTCIITGSNMSGKTTFLRSIGINLILAYAGAPVCAQAMSASMMALFTSMRVNDDVSKGISTFYAELLRVKMMVDYSKQRQPMLVLIDEIFKGTNSADRIVGAQTVIKHLAKPWVISMVSTHDFELCQLADDPSVMGVNYHFAEYYQDNQIHFDYQMRPGQCQTTNARHLMAMVGLMDEVPLTVQNGQTFKKINIIER